MLFPALGRVDVWRRPKEAYNPECLVPIVKAEGGSVMIWTATSWYSADPIITVNGQITASDYMDVLGNQVHSAVQMFPNSDAVFQDDNSHIHNPKCEGLGLRSMKMHFNILASTVAKLKISSNNCGHFQRVGEKQIPALFRIYSKKDTTRIMGKWWLNSMLVKKSVSQLFPLFCPSSVYQVPEGISLGSPISSIIAKIFTTL